jgi:hypothetical protein
MLFFEKIMGMCVGGLTEDYGVQWQEGFINI